MKEIKLSKELKDHVEQRCIPAIIKERHEFMVHFWSAVLITIFLANVIAQIYIKKFGL